MKARCCKLVKPDNRCYYSRQCQHIGKVKREGKWYCHQHDPVNIKKRQAATAAMHKSKEDKDREIEQEANRLAKALGCGQPYYDKGWGSNDHGYREFLLISFEDVKRLIDQAKRK